MKSIASYMSLHYHHILTHTIMHTGIIIIINLLKFYTIIICKTLALFDIAVSHNTKSDCTYSQRGSFFSSEKSLTHFPLIHITFLPQWTADIP